MLFPVPSPQDETVPNGEAELGKQTCGTWAIQNYEPVSPEAAEAQLPRALWCSITFQATASITLRRQPLYLQQSHPNAVGFALSFLNTDLKGRVLLTQTSNTNWSWKPSEWKPEMTSISSTWDSVNIWRAPALSFYECMCVCVCVYTYIYWGFFL